MTHSADWSWRNSEVYTDSLWLEDSLNWDNAFDISLAEFNVLSALFTAAFLNAHHFLDWIVKLSILDLIFIIEVDSDALPRLLFLSTMHDDSLLTSATNLMLPSLYHADYQDMAATTLHYTPELVLATRDYNSAHFSNAAASVSPSAVFDTYQDSTAVANTEFFDYFSVFAIFFCLVGLLNTSYRISRITNDVNAQIARIYLYVYHLSVEVRFQFEAALQVFFFTFLYTSMMMATFDDDQEELSEFFNSMCYYFFLSTLVYYLYKYSVHYFSYLEASKGDSKAVSPITQFLFDALNSIALVLRFLVLMIRLNIYDGVDDVLDSYYIFMADFEEEEYFSDAFFSLFSVMTFDTDVNDDRSFLFEDEMDLSVDLFTIYFLVWGKFAYFWLFILEEIARVGLALYVTYLVIFEINAVNRSYSEDHYLASKRSTTSSSSLRKINNI